MTRKIECVNCHKPMGEVRDASLRKGIVYMCSGCNLAREDAMSRLAALMNKDKFSPGGDFSDIFGDIFGDKKY